MLLLCLSLSHTIVYGEMLADVSPKGQPITAVAIDVPVFPPMSTCEHVYRIPPNAKIIAPGWYYVNDLCHEYRQYYTALCIKEDCASDTQVCIADQLTQHTWEYTGVNEHLKGEDLHGYTHKCPVCQGTKTCFFDCPGTGDGNCPAQILSIGAELQSP